jgi:pilus assembly protein CpaC
MELAVKRACILAWLLGGAWTAAAREPLPETLDMFVGDSRVLGASVTRIAVGNGKVLSVSVINQDSLLLLGEGSGTTILQLWLTDGTRHRLLVRVSETDIEGTLQAVTAMLGNQSELSVRRAGSRLVLDAGVATEGAAQRAAAIAQLFPGVVVNLVGKSNLDRMIHFDVKIVEFRRAKLRELGIRWREDIAGPHARIAVDAATPQALRTRPVQAYLGWVSDIDSRVRLLEENGDATVMAEPTLSCRSGGSARFVAGGEIPIPVVDRLGSTDVEYKEYGVILDVKPVADSTGAIVGRVDTEVSQVDPAQSVLGVPGFLKRRSATDVTMRDGETLVIAGLVNRAESSTVNGVPGLQRLPGAGRAFRSRAARAESTELVIFITPRLVSVAPGDATADDSTVDRDELLRRARDALRDARGTTAPRPVSPAVPQVPTAEEPRP